MKIQRVLLLLCMAVCSLEHGLLGSDPAPEPQLPKKVKSAWKVARSYLLDNRVVRSTVIPVLMKIEKIKDEGVSGVDVAKGAMYGALAYGAFKFAQGAYHVLTRTAEEDTQEKKLSWAGAQRSCDTTAYTEKSEQSFSMSTSNLVALTAFLAGYAYLFFQEERDHLRTDALLPFFETFTASQRTAIAKSNELKLLVRDAHLNPSLLQENAAFMALLNDEQKKQLDSIIQDDAFSLDLLLEMHHHHQEHQK